MSRIRFAKMHGAGNDLVIIDCLGGDPVADWAAFARFALDRRLGVGGDQLLLVQPSRDCLRVLAGAVATLRVNAAAMGRAAADPMLLATDLADHLVSRGVAFREAHGIVGRVVAHAIAQKTSLAELSRAALREFHPALDLEPAEFFSVERSLEARRAFGAPSRARVQAAVAEARAELARTREALAREKP